MLNKELLEKTAKQIENEEFPFSMKWFYMDNEPDWKGKLCDTIACIGGHIAVAAGIELGTEIEPLNKVVQQLAGLTDNQALELFYGRPEKNAFVETSPTQAARTIRHLIATGEVNWNLEEKE